MLIRHSLLHSFDTYKYYLPKFFHFYKLAEYPGNFFARENPNRNSELVQYPGQRQIN